MKTSLIKKQMDDEFEQIEAMGSDNEKEGIEATKKIIPQELKVAKEKEAIILEGLKKKSQFKKQDYINNLAEILMFRLAEDDFPKSVTYEIAPTSIGVYMELYIEGRMFNQAFKATGEPVYDLNAINVFVMRTESMVQKIWTEMQRSRNLKN